MGKKIPGPKKARRCKNSPLCEEKDVEKTPEKDNAPVFENEQEVPVEESDQESGPQVEDEEEVGEEGKNEVNGEKAADEKEDKVGAEEKVAAVKPGRPKRQLKASKDVVAKPEEEVKGHLTQQYADLELAEAAKGKKKTGVRFQSKKEEIGKEEVEDTVVREPVSSEKEEDFGTKVKKHTGPTAAATGGNKRGRMRKADVPKDVEDASTVDQRADEKVVSKHDAKVNKRGVRGTKRGAGEDEIEDETREPDTLSSEDISDFRCSDHQYDPETKTLQFKLTRGRKMKLITYEEAKKFAMPTCFDYMVQNLMKN